MSEPSVLLRTDVVDSTLQSEQYGDAAMARWWEAHDRAARDLLPPWRGREIDKSDGFLLLFERVADAVGYAFAYHRMLAMLDPPLQARAGVHTGALALRENTAADIARGAKPLEVDGVAKPVTSRAMSVALPGQTLLTAAARAVLEAAADAPAYRLHNHGYWRFKGVESPIELHEVSTEADAAAPGLLPDGDKAYRVLRRGELWLPVRQVRHSLPAERDAFIGRRDALADLARRFDGGARLVSITGTGGTGKTRLSLRCGWSRLGEHAGGVWFCDLAAARGLDGLVHAVAQGLDVALGADDPVTRIGHAIAGRGPCLVILDNFEQVAEHAEATLGRWLDRAPESRFLVTTRELLGMSGEEALQLPPLAVLEGATLFMQRAGAANSSFQPDDEDLAAVNPLVQLLDGLPLAIELAAARVRVMSPAELLARMSQRFELLATAKGARHPRHATLRATFDWSWDLLAPDEKATLAQLSVFEGGFTLASAAAVVDLGTPAPAVIDMLQALVDKSFVRAVGEQRFDLLVSVQAYAAEHLASAGRWPGSGPGAEAAAQQRHWRWFAGYDEKQATARRCIESDNLVAACRRAAHGGDAVAAVGALHAAWAALRQRGPYRVLLELADLLETTLELSDEEQAAVHCIAGQALQALGRGAQAKARLEAGLRLAGSFEGLPTQILLHCAMGEHLSVAGQFAEAEQQLTVARDLAVQQAARALECRALHNLGAAAYLSGRYPTARTFFDQALAMAIESGDESREGALIGNLSTLDFEQGLYAEAERRDQRALVLALQKGDRAWEGNTRNNLGLSYHELGRNAEAQAEFEASLAIATELGLQGLQCAVHCNLGIALEQQHLLSDAQQQYEAAVTSAAAIGDLRSEGQFRGYLGRLYARLGLHDKSAPCFASGQALLLETHSTVALALLLYQWAEAEHAGGNIAATRERWEEATSLLDVGSLGDGSELHRAMTRARALWQ